MDNGITEQEAAQVAAVLRGISSDWNREVPPILVSHVTLEIPENTASPHWRVCPICLEGFLVGWGQPGLEYDICTVCGQRYLYSDQENPDGEIHG